MLWGSWGGGIATGAGSFCFGFGARDSLCCLGKPSLSCRSGKGLPTSSRRKPPNFVIPAKPHFVIPAKAGIQLFAFALTVRLSRQPTRIPACFTRHPWRASYFSLLAQREVTKRKAPRVGRPPLSRRVRYGRPGSADSTSCAAAESARSLAPTPAGPFRPPFAAPHGDPGSKAKRPPIGWALAHRGGAHRWAEAHPINHGFASAAGRRALLSSRGPPRPRRGREGKSP